MDGIELGSCGDSPFGVCATYPERRVAVSLVNSKRTSMEVLPEGHTERYSVSNPESKPNLECFIVPSYGSDPPSSVAIKKEVESDFLKGVGNDSKIIQGLIKEDTCKDLAQVEIICHFEQKKVAEFKNKIEDEMKRLKLRPGKKGRKLVWPARHISSPLVFTVLRFTCKRGGSRNFC